MPNLSVLPAPGTNAPSVRGATACVVAVALLAAGLAWFGFARPAPSLPAAILLFLHAWALASGISLCSLAFALGWTSRAGPGAGVALVLGIAFLGLGFLDFMQLVLRLGIPGQSPAAEGRAAEHLALAGQALAAFAMLAAAFRRPRSALADPVRRWTLISVIGLTVLVAAAIVVPVLGGADSAGGSQPDQGSPATAGVVLTLLFLAAAWQAWRGTDAGDAIHGGYRFPLAAAAAAFAGSEVLFLWQREIGPVGEFGAELYLLAASALVCRALYVHVIEAPGLALGRATVELEQARAEVRVALEGLDENKSQFKSIIDSAMDAVISIDETQRVVLFNHAAEKIFRIDAAGALGQPIERFLPARFRAAHGEQVRRFGTTGLTERAMGRGRQLYAERSDGSEFPIDASISHTLFRGRRLYTVILRDVSERKRLEDEVGAAAERLREFALIEQNNIELERKRMAGALHDELGQALVALRMDIDDLRGRLGPRPAAPEGAAGELHQVTDRMEKVLASAIAETRRIISDLRPKLLDDLGVAAAIEHLLEEHDRRFGVRTSFVERGEFSDLPPHVQVALFRIAQESLTNIAKHAEAGRIEVLLERSPEAVSLEVKDDGRGFDTGLQRKPGSYGLFGLQERAALVGGTVAIESAPGRGTVIRARFALAPAASERPDGPGGSEARAAGAG